MELANNLSRSLVIKALVEACNQDPVVLKHAESLLKAWETQPGFYTTVADVFMSQEFDDNVRCLAALYFKNGIERYWRRTAQSSISEEEKQLLKQHLISKFNEPIPRIALQISVLIGKIARLDCPKFWPELIPSLLQAVQVNDILQQHRAMLTLYHVTKSLASKRLAPDKKVFEELTSDTFGFLFNLWKQYFDEFVCCLNLKQVDLLPLCLTRYILITKTLKKLIVQGFQDIRHNSSAMEFVELVLHRLDCFLQSKSVLQELGSQELMVHREKIILLFSKVLLEVMGNYEEGFAKFVKSSLEFVTVYCFTEERRELVFESFVVNSLNLVKKILKCDKYKLSKIPEETGNDIATEVNRVKTEFFTTEVLSELCKKLVLHYFLLSKKELDSWKDDPECFVSEESGDSWMFSLRPCTEALFLNLIKEYRDIVVPVVLELLRESEACNDNTLDNILRKDAVYNTIGLAKYDFCDLINFDGWFHKLIDDLQNKSSDYRILRRRIIWLIGNWVGAGLSTELRPKLYMVIQSLMDKSEDLVVRLEAASALKAAIDDAEFHAENFVPFLECHFNLLFNLLQDVSECETKMAVLHVMTFIIERMEDDIRPYTSSLVHYLPLLWQTSEDHYLLRCAIINNLSLIVQGLGSESINLYGFLVPVLRSSTDVKQDQHVYLWEDALDLWLNTLHACPRMTPELLHLFQNLMPLLENGTEALKTCMKIVEAYVMLDSTVFLESYHGMLRETVMALLREMKTEGEVIIFKLLSNMLRVCPAETVNVFSPVFMDMIKQMADLNGSPSTPCPSLYCMYIVMVSRIVIHNHQLFYHLVNNVAMQMSFDSCILMDSVIKGWLAKFNCLYQPEKKKLCILAFLSLLSTNHKSVLNNVANILHKTVDTLNDVCRADSETGVMVDTCVMTSNNQPMYESGDEVYGEEFEKRNLEICLRDPVYSTSLLQYTATQLQLLQRPVLDALDIDTSLQLKHFLSNFL